MDRTTELMPNFRRMNRTEITGDRTRHVLTFNPNSAKPGEEIYVNIPKLKADFVLVPDSMAKVFDFKNIITNSWFRNNLGKLLNKILKDHGLYAPHNMANDLQYVITLPESDEIMSAQGGEDVEGYTLENIELEYESIDNIDLERKAENLYGAERELSFEHAP